MKKIVLFNMLFCWDKEFEPNEFEPQPLIAADNFADKGSLQSVGLDKDKGAFCFWVWHIIRITNRYEYTNDYE